MEFRTASMHEDIRFDREKFKAVVHYVCANVPVEELGRVKLHKILYFADMLHYVSTGVPLTGVDYQKQPFGPAARHLKAGLDQLEKEGALEVKRSDYFGFPKFDFIVRRQPEAGFLTNWEQTLLTEIMNFVRQKSAREVSDFSHNDAWRSVEMGERIPYYSAFSLYPVEIGDEDLTWAEQEAETIVATRAAHAG